MSNLRDRIWSFGPPVALALLITALYVKRPEVRDFIDGHCPWVKNTVGKYAPPFETQPSGAVGEATQPVTPGAIRSASGPETEAAAPVEAPKPAASAFDLQRVYADASRWPKLVRLKSEVEFPAVVDGKVVGKVRVPAGTEAHVVKIESGKVGLEYRGGGAWVELDRTDFVERAKVAWH